MKNNRLTRNLFAFVLLAMVSVASHAGKDGDFRAIVGAWNASIEFNGATSNVLYVFHKDRTLVEADNPGFDPNFGGDALSPGVGSWALSKDNESGKEIQAKYQKLAYNKEGKLHLVYTSTMTVNKVQEDSIEGTVSIQIATPDGKVVNEIPPLSFTANKISAK